MIAVFQFSSVAAWVYIRAYSTIGATPVLEMVQSLHPLQILLGVGLIAFGQILNVGIFKAIGHAGVYYGFKLGHTIPWVDGFPFNVVQHPQYVGSVATVWGAALLLWSFVPVADMILLVFYWTALYVLTGIMESCT
jgi:protein-S-isoprenylcysteine O-methyltransferase Ste14